MMPGQIGISYVRKVGDHMHKVIVRPCPTCGAKAGEVCTVKSGRKVKDVTEVHSARFKSGRLKWKSSTS